MTLKSGDYLSAMINLSANFEGSFCYDHIQGHCDFDFYT